MKCDILKEMIGQAQPLADNWQITTQRIGA